MRKKNCPNCGRNPTNGILWMNFHGDMRMFHPSCLYTSIEPGTYDGNPKTFKGKLLYEWTEAQFDVKLADDEKTRIAARETITRIRSIMDGWTKVEREEFFRYS